ncbi:Hypothetical protein BCAN_A1808 [Brucella canis ATCC 23365]|uniref:Uncharacterized protein n=1 Tax=Brucella canis (strain ATCC 23365 / NCTC 10854 / RM-666) TaxID=483179 RepID=A9M813_BRUC2|nr:Hypothetical protein BCAN_A1808 [Brucella canis ATCC 23365]
MIALWLALIATTEFALRAFALAFAVVLALVLIKALVAATRILFFTTLSLACRTTLFAVLMAAILVATMLVSTILALAILVLIAVAAFKTALTPQKNRLRLFRLARRRFSNRSSFDGWSRRLFHFSLGFSSHDRRGNRFCRRHGWLFSFNRRGCILATSLGCECIKLRKLRRHRSGFHCLTAIAKALEDFFHILGCRPQDGHHGRRHDEASTIISAIRASAGTRTPGKSRANEIGKALQNIDANRAPAQHTIASETVEHRIEGRINHDRGAASGQHIDDIAVTCPFAAIVLERPEKRDEASRGRL